jgi:hypothetical protein
LDINLHSFFVQGRQNQPMKMMILRLKKLLLPLQNVAQKSSRCASDWIGEPMDHPALCLMSQRQLADLPIPAFAIDKADGEIKVCKCSIERLLQPTPQIQR